MALHFRGLALDIQESGPGCMTRWKKKSQRLPKDGKQYLIDPILFLRVNGFGEFVGV